MPLASIQPRTSFSATEIMAEKKTDSGIILIEEETESTEVESSQSSKSSIIQDDGEVTKEDSGIIIVDKETKSAEENPPQSAETSIIVASDLLPTSLIIVPLFDRPFFPKMMVPILLSNEELVNNILESLNDKQKYVGLLFAEETDAVRFFCAFAPFHPWSIA